MFFRLCFAQKAISRQYVHKVSALNNLVSDVHHSSNACTLGKLYGRSLTSLSHVNTLLLQGCMRWDAFEICSTKGCLLPIRSVSLIVFAGQKNFERNIEPTYHFSLKKPMFVAKITILQPACGDRGLILSRGNEQCFLGYALLKRLYLGNMYTKFQL